LAFHSGREADHSPPSSAKVKELVELCLHSPNTPSWRGAQLGGAQGQLYFTCLTCDKIQKYGVRPKKNCRSRNEIFKLDIHCKVVPVHALDRNEGKIPLYPLKRRLDRPQAQFEHGNEE
jgi:hypothetical protein